jgi:cell shape-determining protein MreD
MIPLGYSSFLFCLAAWLVNRVREEVYIWHWTTHLLFGALLNAGVNLGLYLLLALNDLIGMRLFMLTLRVLGSALLGGVVVPLVFRVAQSLETRLGVMEKRAVA